jgi:hypothetical protein
VRKENDLLIVSGGAEFLHRRVRDFIKKQAAHWYRENARVSRLENWSSEKGISKRQEVEFILLRLDFMLNSEDEFLIINE